MMSLASHPQTSHHQPSSSPLQSPRSNERTPTASSSSFPAPAPAPLPHPPSGQPSTESFSSSMATSLALTPSSSFAPGPSMSKASSGSMDHAAFDLPPMPVPYEDFHFSLDLPDNVQASDISLLDSSNFETLFGGVSGSLTPSLVSSSALFGTATPAVHTPAASGPHDAVMTSMPSSSSQGYTAETQSPALQAQTRAGPSGPPLPPQPPADLRPPQGDGTFSFDSLFGSGITSPSQEQPSGVASMTIPSGSSSRPLGQRQPLSHQQSLFDTNESDFLSSFLEGFESSWDFNPALPEGMPSFAAAAAQHSARNGTSNGSQYAGSEGKTPTSGGSGATVTSPALHQPNSAAFGRWNRGAAGSKRSTSRSHDWPTPPDPSQVHASSSAAFGEHLDEAEEGDQVVGGIGSKRGMVSSGSGRIGDEKRRGSVVTTSTAMLNGSGPADGHHLATFANSNGNMGGPQQPQQQPFPFQQHNPMMAPWTAHQHQHSQQGIGSYPAIPHHPMATAPSVPHANFSADVADQQQQQAGMRDSAGAAKRELLTEKEKRQNHILSEQRRRNHIREGFTELVALLDLGRLYGARGLGLSSGAGTGIEDEGLDDRTDVSSGEESDPEAAALAKARRKKAKSKRNAALNAAVAGGSSTGASRGKGKGRGRGGSAGGGAGSKSAVLFQAVDLIKWLEVRNATLEEECQDLEQAAGCGSEPAVPVSTASAAVPATNAVVEAEGAAPNTMASVAA